MNIKNKLQELKKKLRPNLTLPELGSLIDELQEIFNSLKDDKNKKEERKIGEEINEAIYTEIFKRIDQLEGETELQKADMVFLHQWCMGLEALEYYWAEIEKDINKVNFLDDEEKQRTIKQIKKDIEKFKKYKPKLEKIFQKYKKQVQENSPSAEEDEANETSSEEKSPQSEKINSLDIKIRTLESQIGELKEKLNSADQETQQAINQKIEDLGKKKQEIQTQLNELKQEVSSTNSSIGEKKSKKNKKDKGFPVWGIILIVLGILVAIGIAGYFILEKKEREKTKKKGK